MANNSQKVWFARSLNTVAERKAANAIQITGKSLPASVVSVAGSIVTVKFELNTAFTLPNVTCPLAGPEYIRYPTQVGDKGAVISVDALLGGISGLGSGIASLTTPANLSALIFFPIGNANWTANPNPNQLLLYGHAGVSVWDSINNNASVVTTATGITLTFGSVSVALSSSGVAIEGNLTINGAPYLMHKHSGVTTGGGNSGGVV